MREPGMALIVSTSTTRCCFTLWTSTIGLSPVTLMVSSSEPSRRSASTVAVSDPDNCSPSRFTVENPVSENVTL